MTRVGINDWIVMLRPSRQSLDMPLLTSIPQTLLFIDFKKYIIAKKISVCVCTYIHNPRYSCPYPTITKWLDML